MTLVDGKTNPLLADALDAFDDVPSNTITLAFKYDETQQVVATLEAKIVEQAQRIEDLESEEAKVNKGLLRLSDECPGAYSHFYKAYQET